MRPLATLLLAAGLLAGLPWGAADGASPASGSCGNKLLDPGETCAQCAADCAVQTCTPAKVRSRFAVEFTAPEIPAPSTAVVLVSYRSDRLHLPGSGADQSVQRRLTFPTHAVMAYRDLDYALRLVAGHANAIPLGTLMTIDFDRCQGAPAPTVADLSCQIESCANSNGATEGCSCRVVAAAP